MFNDECEYMMDDDLVSNFRDGMLYYYVGYNFLNAYINYTEIIKSYLLERYRSQGKNYDKNVWQPFLENGHYHTDLRDLDDDVLILSETKDHYYFFLV